MSNMISDTMSGMISYKILVSLLIVLILDLTIVIQVLRLCSTDSTFNGFSVAVGVRDISSIQLTARTSAHRALIDIAQQCSCNLSAIHDQYMIKCTTQSDLLICKAKVYIPGAQLINVLNDVIHGSMVQLKTPVPKIFQRPGEGDAPTVRQLRLQ